MKLAQPNDPRTAAGVSRRLRLAMADAGQPPEAAAREARRLSADLLILAERPAIAAEASDGPLARALGDIAAAHAMPLLFAYAEACSGRTHMALQLVQADGGATANCRATHLDAALIEAGWAPGNWLTMARLGPFTLGLMAGLDHLAPEVARAFSAVGLDLLLAVPEASPPPALWPPLARLRAIENGVATCLAGAHAGLAAADAKGDLLDVARAAGLSLVTIELAENGIAAPRRPDLYRRLVQEVADY